MTLSNHYKTLLIDIGNSYIKLATTNNEQILEFVQFPVSTNMMEVLSGFNDLDNVNKVFILTNARIENQLLILKAKFKKADFKIINKDDFEGLLDLSNVDKDVVIGNDILLLNFWASKQKDVKAVVCLGSVYFALVNDGKKFKSVILLPSLVKGLDMVEHQSSIPSSLIPSKFDKTIGLNTPDCFATGLNLTINGFIDQIAKTYKLDKNEIVITGGDCNKYESLKAYKIIDHLTIKAMLLLIKEKHW